MNQVVDRLFAALSCLGQVSSDLGIPGGIGGAVGYPADKDLPRVQVDEEKDVEGFKRTDSTVKRSQAMIDKAWVRMNRRQVSRPAGGRRFSARIRRMLVVEISAPTFLSSPRRRQ